jgi:hypothetical protein
MIGFATQKTLSAVLSNARRVKCPRVQDPKDRPVTDDANIFKSPPLNNIPKNPPRPQPTFPRLIR